MTRLKRIIVTVMATLGFVMPALAPVAVRAQQEQIDENLRCGASLSFSGGECETEGSAAGRVDEIVANVINILSLIVGVVAVIMIIIGGLRYVTSSGDSGQVGNAKNTIIYAIVGLVVVALAQVLVRFVVGRATGEASGTDD